MIDVNIKGVLYGIAAALPIFRAQASGHFINISSVAGHVVRPTMAVYSGTKYAVRAISEGLRQEVGDKIRVTIISPGAVESELAETISDPALKQQIDTYRQDRDPIRRDRPRHRLCDRAAGRGRCQRDPDSSRRAAELSISRNQGLENAHQLRTALT